MRLIREELRKSGIAFSEGEALAKHSSFRIGGDALLAVFPKTEEEFLAALALTEKEDPLVVGRGSNLVFPDGRFERPVIFTEGLRRVNVDGKTILAEAGLPLTALCNIACDASLAGLSFAYGIPGSVGGGVYMNAGAYGGEIGSLCASVRYYDRSDRTVKKLLGRDCAFSYRHSFFADYKDCVILSASFDLTPGDKERIASEMRDYLERRKRTQPLEFPSAGSVFKRPVGAYAGKLIEECGLKGSSVGGASVSEKHAGFIINRGNATAADVKTLVEQIRETVLQKSGILLECEIEFL